MNKKFILGIVLFSLLVATGASAFTPVTDPTGVTFTNGDVTSTKNGVLLTTLEDIRILNVTKDSSNTATHCYIYDSDFTTQISNSTFSGNVCQFSDQPFIVAGTNFTVLTDANGASSNRRRPAGTVTFPITGTNVDYISGMVNLNTINTDYVYNIVSITTIESLPPSINFSITARDSVTSAPLSTFNASVFNPQYNVFEYIMSNTTARNDGTVSGGVTISDGAMVFDGSSGFVTISDLGDIEVGTYIMKLNIYSTESSYNRVLSSETSSNNGKVFSLRNSDRQIFMSFGTGVISSGFTLLNGENTIAMSYDGTSARYYVNNVLVQTVTNPISNFGSSNLRLGRSQHTSASFWNGSQNWLRVYDDVLSLTEIINESSSDYAVRTTNLVAQYSGRDFAGTPSAPTTIYDTKELNQSTYLELITTPKFYSTTTGLIETDILPDVNYVFNITVEAQNYYDLTIINYNVSSNLQANINEFPRVRVTNLFDNSGLTGQIYINVTEISGITPNLPVQFDAVFNINDGLAFLPYNNTQSLYFYKENYFPQEVTVNFATTKSVNISTAQAERRFQATEIITGKNLGLSNFTIGSFTTNNGMPFYLNVGTYSVLAQKTNWNSISQNVTVSALTNQTTNIQNMYLREMNLTGFNFSNNATVNTFSVNVQSSGATWTYNQDFNTTTGLIQIPVGNNTQVNLTFNSPGFQQVQYLNHNVNNDLNTPFFTQGHINVRFLSASSGAVINQDIAFLAQNSTNQFSYTFNNGTGLITNLKIGNTFLFTANTTGFVQGTFNRQLINPTLEQPTMDFYLTVDGQQVEFTVVAADAVALSGALITIDKFVDGVYQLVGSATTDVTGKAYLIQELGNTHRITITADGYVTQQFIVANLQLEYYIVMQSSGTIDLDLGFAQVSADYQPKKTRWNITEQIIPYVVTIQSPTGILEWSGFRLIDLNTNQELYIFNSTATNGGVYVYDLNISNYNNTRIQLQYFFKIQNNEPVFQSILYNVVQQTSYSGSLMELRSILDSELTFFQKLFYWTALFLVTMIVLAVFVRGVGNLILSVALSLMYAFILGLNIFVFIGMASIIIMIAIAKATREPI